MTPAAVRVSLLGIGTLLSLAMIVPSIRTLPLGIFSAVYHVVMLTALALPFLIISAVSRRRSWTTPAVTLATLFSLGHVYLIYVSYASPPQEFGYVGLIFAPVLEAVVAIPLGFAIVAIVTRGRRD